MASNPASLTCDHCGETFLRREHRDRHLRRHSGAKPFQCDVCHKAFARSDTLVRHRNLHRHEDQTRSTPRRCAHACISCARLKQRCLGGLPCARCQDTGAECTYSLAKAASPQALLPPRPSDMPGSLVGAPNAPQLDRHDNAPELSASFLTASKPPRPAEPNGLHPNAITPTSNCHDTSSISPANITHPMSAPAVFASPPLDVDSAFHVPDLWDPSLFLHGNAGLDEFAPEWDSLAAYFPFWPAPEGPVEELGTQYDRRNHNQQGGVDAHVRPEAHHLRTQATPTSFVEWPHQTAPDPSSDPAMACQTTAGGRSGGDSLYRRFPQTQDIHIQMAKAESFGHVRSIPSRAYEGARKFYANQCRDPTAGFIPIRLVRTFVDLYFEYFDPQFPFLHVSHLEAEELPWILLLATAAIGSNYSALDGIRDYTSILCDLLDRAVDQEAITQVTRPTKPLIQCLFLRHVHFTFCGLHKKIILTQYKRYMLVAMCRDLMARKKAERTAASNALAPHYEWATWLAKEEETRLICCIYMLQCILFLFMDVPTDFNLSDFTQKMPCNNRLWYAKDIQDWHSKQSESPAGQTQPRASPETHVPKVEYDPFLSRMSLLALYTNGKNIQRQRRSSRFLMSTFGSHLQPRSASALETPIDCFGMETDGVGVENPLLDEAIDKVVFETWEPVPGRGHHVETLPHLLGILRCVSLRTLHAGTGWRTDVAQMTRLKMQFREFLDRDGMRARKCMWHAAYIFKAVQGTQRFACYDVYSFGMATCYMVLYVELLRRTPSSPGRRRRIVRLDQLSGREDVQHWIQSGGDADIHLTNVGILDGPDALPRLLRATEKALVGQIAWSVFSRVWARLMVQLRHGEMLTVRTEDYSEVDERESDK